MGKRGPGRRSARNTEGRRLLARYLRARSQQSLASDLGIVQSSISAWKEGRSRPEAHFREALERLTLIPFAAWYSADELAIARGSKVS